MPSRTTQSGTDLVVGIDLGGTNAQVGLVDARGHVMQRVHMPTNAGDGWRRVIDRLAEGVQAVCKANGMDTSAIRAIGIGAPGTIDYATGNVAEAPNLRWNDVPLAKTLSDLVSVGSITIDNDVNAALAGEAAFGAAKGERNVLGVWVGTGIGGAIILDGKLIQGPYGSAGEIGRMLLFPTSSIGTRLLEEHCSRSAIAERLYQLVAANAPSVLKESLLATDDPRAFPTHDIAQAYINGDELVGTVIDEAADLLGRGIASAVTLLGTPVVIIGGGLAESLGQPYVDAIAHSCNNHVLPRLRGRLHFRLTALGSDAGMIGAAAMARNALNTAG